MSLSDDNSDCDDGNMTNSDDVTIDQSNNNTNDDQDPSTISQIHTGIVGGDFGDVSTMAGHGDVIQTVTDQDVTPMM